MTKNGNKTNNGQSKDQGDAVNRLVSDVKEKGKHLFSEGVESARHLWEENADMLREKANELSDKSFEEVTEDVKFYVRRNPIRSIGITFGIGFLLGYILKSD